jgi:hypothetical protein
MEGRQLRYRPELAMPRAARRADRARRARDIVAAGLLVSFSALIAIVGALAVVDVLRLVEVPLVDDLDPNTVALAICTTFVMLVVLLGVASSVTQARDARAASFATWRGAVEEELRRPRGASPTPPSIAVVPPAHVEPNGDDMPPLTARRDTTTAGSRKPRFHVIRPLEAAAPPDVAAAQSAPGNGG